MKEYENVRKVKCEENKCIIFHDSIESEVDISGIMMNGETVVRGRETEVTLDDGKCKTYDDVLVCKGGEW